ncbi:hypothetical protein CRG98_032075 [Punica granatum]|uniref:Uncharacterized protein n=1 Tax=Punica granatum TaxID=22663 RepID=A0A2I0IU03_PUNGR|nr:hypothetical protein CRG98_032075 [Punica granatum]
MTGGKFIAMAAILGLLLLPLAFAGRLLPPGIINVIEIIPAASPDGQHALYALLTPLLAVFRKFLFLYICKTRTYTAHDLS